MKSSNRPALPVRLKADLLLLFVTLLWGSAFVVMRVAAGHGTVFLLNGSRFLLGGLLLLPFVKLKGAFPRASLPFVGLAGLALFAGVALQQAGLATTAAGNAGFITSLSVVVVPFILWIGWRERPALLVGAAVLLAVAGAFLLSTGGRFTVRIGDVLILAGTFFWALHIVVVGKGQGGIAPLPFAVGQYFVCGLLSLAAGALMERPSWTEALFVLPAVIYTAVFSIAIGFTIQVTAQNHTPPTDAALLLSLEGVAAAAFGWLFLKESLSALQLAGCALILAAVALAQVRPEMVKYRKGKEGAK
jgi:drug/metabolite transporter (DMT)-like permease